MEGLSPEGNIRPVGKFCGVRKNCRSLGYPGFPVESCGFDRLRVVLFGENHISSGGESGEVGNPGTLGMTKRKG
jgi:hypothetical protein